MRTRKIRATHSGTLSGTLSGTFGARLRETLETKFRNIGGLTFGAFAVQLKQRKQNRGKKHGQPIQQKPKRMKFDHLDIASTSATQENMILANAHFVRCSSSSCV